MSDVPSNLIPTRITGLPEYLGTSTLGYLPYVIEGNTYKVQFTNIAAVGAVPSTRQINTGTGLGGGGDLSANRTLYILPEGVDDSRLTTTGITAGTYGSAENVPVFTVNAQGRVTGVTETPIVLSNYVPTSRTITAGDGLTGGGNLSANRTFAVNFSSTTPEPLGPGSPGVSTVAAREDHVHPAVDLSDTTETQGVLPLSRGGTGNSLSPVVGAIAYSSNDKLYLTPTAGDVGQVLTSAGGAGAPYWTTVTGVGTVTSVDLTAGTGISVSGGPITSSGSITVVNTAPDQIVSLTGAGLTSVTGTYPNFTITSTGGTGTVSSVDASGGTTGLTFTGGPITSTGTLTLGGTLAVANGGTGAITPQQAAYNINSVYHGTGPILLAIAGQSNAVGVNNGGGNPNNTLVNTWNPNTSAWVSGGQYTSAPWTSSAPTGNSGNNNFALAAAHYLADTLGREVYIVFDALSGQSITEWTGSGTSSTRYAALDTKIQNALATAPFTSVGKTTVDAIIWAQGEENGSGVNFMDYGTYLTNLTTLDSQFRAETWMEEFTPIYIMGMSPLHDRYQISPALQNFSNKSNGTWRYLSTRSLRTEYQETGSGDYTHWLGPSLWEGGYNIIGPAILNNERYSQEAPDSLFYGRGNGAAIMSDPTAISTFTTLVSWDSRDLTSSAVSAPAATGSMMWGYQCVADGNYTFALGYENITDNLSNYTILAGRSLTSSSTGDYAAGFGFQNALNNTYTFAAGRGHTVASTGASAVGLFSAVTTDLADPAIFQVGNGTSTSSRSNALTVYKSGIVTAPTLNLTNALGVAYGGTGATTLTANNVLLGNGTSAVQVVAPGTTGNVLTSDGTTWVSSAPTGGINAGQSIVLSMVFGL